MSGTRSPCPRARATEPALVLATHGVEGGPGVAAHHAARLEAECGIVPVRPACLRGEPSLEAVLDALGARPVLVLPFLMADGYILEWLEKRLAQRHGGAELALLPPLGRDPGIAAVLARMAREEAEAAGRDPAGTTLLLIGHGTPKHPASGRTLALQAERLRTRGSFAAVETAFLEQEPFLEDRARALAGRPVVALGFFVDAGPHGRDDVRRILAGFTAIRYAGVVGERPEITALLARMAAPALRAAPLAAPAS